MIDHEIIICHQNYKFPPGPSSTKTSYTHPTSVNGTTTVRSHKPITQTLLSLLYPFLSLNQPALLIQLWSSYLVSPQWFSSDLLAPPPIGQNDLIMGHISETSHHTHGKISTPSPSCLPSSCFYHAPISPCYYLFWDLWLPFPKSSLLFCYLNSIPALALNNLTLSCPSCFHSNVTSSERPPLTCQSNGSVPTLGPYPLTHTLPFCDRFCGHRMLGLGGAHVHLYLYYHSMFSPKDLSIWEKMTEASWSCKEHPQ